MSDAAPETAVAAETVAAPSESSDAEPRFKQDPTITEDEAAVMKEVLSNVTEDDAKYLQNVLTNPSRLVKYVRARKLDAKKAVAMLHATAKFRRKKNHSDLMTRFKPNKDFETVLLFPVHYLRDRDGGLILYHRTGHFCGSYFCKYYSVDYLIDLVAYCLEILTNDAMRHMEKTGAAPYITFVLDFTGYGSHVLGPMGTTQTLINVFQNHFPETMKRAIILNAPWIFRAVWTVVQAFLDPVVKGKIKMLVRFCMLRCKNCCGN